LQSDALVISLGNCTASLGNCGEIAIAFVRAMGSALQADFDAVGNGGLAPGKVAVSKLQNALRCQRLLYLGLDRWTGDETATVRFLFFGLDKWKDDETADIIDESLKNIIRWRKLRCFIPR
jgi:hypothetical protein